MEEEMVIRVEDKTVVEGRARHCRRSRPAPNA